MSQSVAAAQSGLPLHKLKRFEAIKHDLHYLVMPDQEFNEGLRSFFEGKGYKFEDTPEPGANSKQSGLVFPDGVVKSRALDDVPGKGPIKSTFHHMRIALADPEMGHVLDLIEENEAKVSELLDQPVKRGLVEQFSDKTEATHCEVLKLLADNGMLFAKLFGRDISGTADDGEDIADDGPIDTHRDLLNRVHADTLLAAKGDRQAKDRRKKKPLANTLSSAIFG